MLAFLIAVGAAIAVIVLMLRAARLETSLQELSFRVALLEGPRAAAAPGTAAAPRDVAPPATAAEAAPAPEAPPATAEPAVAESPAPHPGDPATPPAPPGSAAQSPPPISAEDERSPEKLIPLPGFEEQFGTRWVVWLGGIAVALGGVFLVQYSIEQDMLGPEVRVVLAAIVALALISAGEFLRRFDLQIGFGGFSSAHVPSMLTAAGIVVAFGDAYAAYALYNFIDATSAFFVMAGIAFAALAASLRHGPGLAWLGMAGAYVVPLLVGSSSPNYWALTFYILFVTATSFALARARRWRILALVAMALSALWVLPGISDVDAVNAHAALILGCMALAAIMIVPGFHSGPGAESDAVDDLSSFAVAIYLFAAAILVFATEHDGGALATFVVASAATLLIAWRAEAAASAVVVAGTLLLAVVGDWVLRPVGLNALLAGNPHPGPAVGLFDSHVLIAVFVSAALAAGGLFAQARFAMPAVPVIWAATGTVVPLLVVVLLYCRIASPATSYGFAALALLLALAASSAAERTMRLPAKTAGADTSAALFAVAAVAAIALMLWFALDSDWQTAAYALTAAGIAWVGTWRPLPALRWLAVAMMIVSATWAVFLAATRTWETGGALAAWLVVAYAVPAASFAVGGMLLRRTSNDLPARIMDSMAVVFGVTFVFLEIQALVTGRLSVVIGRTFTELALEACAALLLAFGFERLRQWTQSPVHNGAAVVLAVIGLGLVANLAIPANPWFHRVPVGGQVFNLILLGYLLPAALLAAMAYWLRDTRPAWYRTILVVTAVVMALLYLTLSVTRLYHGPIVAYPIIGDAEQYTYSVVWLAFGAALLLIGLATRSQPVRLASAAVTLATVAKVFLVDLSDLTGIWRAISFLGLGVVLIATGWLYQRLLFPHRRGVLNLPQGW